MKPRIRPSSVALWTGILAGPVSWAADLQARYALVKYVCANGAEWIMWVITLAALLITGFGALSSWRGWVDDTPRVRFMAIGGLFIDGMFALAIIAMAIPDIFMRACD
ncbi:MAG TPA: hypothetical protein VJ853_06990 [Thermoanaerobaculia bacterium]|nr:hypothetical protein [Thermoanaerobaculia bacterium]